MNALFSRDVTSNEHVVFSMPKHPSCNRSCKMSGLPAHLGHKLNVATVILTTVKNRHQIVMLLRNVQCCVTRGRQDFHSVSLSDTGKMACLFQASGNDMHHPPDS